MYIFITLAVLPLVANDVACESTKELVKDHQQKTTLKTPEHEVSTSADPPNVFNNLGFLRTNPPTPLQPHEWGGTNEIYKSLLRPPHTLTKLAKTLSLGFDPSFSKDYFEPFERRPRPVTLVAFRKKGFTSRHVVKYQDSKSSEVAELQSPYNEVGSFWQNEQVEA